MFACLLAGRRIAIVSVALALCASGAPAAAQEASVAHPLDPLSQDEIAAAARALRESGKVTPGSRFSTIVLQEPPKAEVLGFKPGDPFSREAFVVVYERGANKTFEAVVDLAQQRVRSWTEIPGVQPPFLVEDTYLAQAILRTDPLWQAAMRKRGITDLNKVTIEAWPAGHYGLPDEDGARLARAFFYDRGDSRMPYAHPIEGVTAVVDLNRTRLVELVDTGVVPVPRGHAGLDENSVGPPRAAPKPLRIVQPEGASFEVRGHEVRWQKWRFRYALHPREGLVLYTAGYEDQGRVRAVLYRAALSEMVVPYADPSAGWFFRNSFDAGELMMGRSALPLEERTDVPDNATLLDAVFARETGRPGEAKRVVALYERDGGVLWKHVDAPTRRNESRRARQLVLSFFTNLGNYEYGFNWVFHQDGALEMEVLLTGVLLTKGAPPLAAGPGDPEGPRHGHLVADGLEAVHHQHFFNFRLDLDVDGTNNTVVEHNTEAAPPGPDNPHHNAFVMTETPLRREGEARRRLDLASQRRWRVINPSVRNGLGQPVGYLLVTGENSVPYLGANSWVRRRAAFMDSHLWVTRYAPEERYAAGVYVNQSTGSDGLPKWIAADRPLENQDVVLWYTMGITHLPRPEDWPVMPVHKAGFKLVPYGFFTRNPALDVPKPE
jgi:primary-amine oxidase